MAVNKAVLTIAMGRAGLNQKQIAEKIGTSETILSDKINGKRPFRADEIIKICEVLNITDPALRGKIFLNSPGNYATVAMEEFKAKESGRTAVVMAQLCSDRKGVDIYFDGRISDCVGLFAHLALPLAKHFETDVPDFLHAVAAAAEELKEELGEAHE